MEKSILDKLPAEMSFLGQCVREVLKLRKGYQPPVDPVECPEEARDAEMDKFMAKDIRILGKAMVESVGGRTREEFYGRVEALSWSLLKWLKPYQKRYNDPEAMMLFTFFGYLQNPVAFAQAFKAKKHGN